MKQTRLAWQSKAVLLAVVPFVAAGLVLEVRWWATQMPAVALWAVGLSVLLGLIVLQLRASTLGGAATGAAITASLMFSTAIYPYEPWRNALPAVLAVFVLAWGATRAGRGRKEQLGTAENRRGRSAAQVAANLGVAALVASQFVQRWLESLHGISVDVSGEGTMMVPIIAALAEAAADTVSSEIGQVLGGRPRMITTWRSVEPGTDGAVSAAGTLAGVGAAAIVASVEVWALGGGGQLSLGRATRLVEVICAGAVFGLLFDSLLGATLERRGWLNNDAVNFLSTASAAGFAVGLLAIVRWMGMG